MAHYLVIARPRSNRLADLRERLRRRTYVSLQPFGRALTYSLTNARLREDGCAVWEEEDYCSPPLAQEREAVLDEFFEELSIKLVEAGTGWDEIESLPRLFPKLTARS